MRRPRGRRSGGANPGNGSGLVLFVLLAVTWPAPQVDAQIDPLVYAPVASTRISLSLSHTYDSFYDESGQIWRTDDAVLQMALEHPIRPQWVATLSVAGAAHSLQALGTASETSWMLDHLSVALANFSRPSWLGSQLTVSGDAAVPLGRTASGPSYGLEASSIWLSDPLALELKAGLRTAPTDRLAYNLGATVTFVANRRYSLASQLAVADAAGWPVTSLWMGLYRQPAVPSDALWGAGMEYRLADGRAVPGLHLVLSMGL